MKRDGFVYSLYLKNIRNLAILTILIVCLYGWELHDCAQSLRNYLWPTEEISWDAVAALGSVTPEASGSRTGAEGLDPDMLSSGQLYQEDGSYRFCVTAEAVEETGIYYDDAGTAYLNCADIDDFYSRLPRENYGVFRLVILEAGGQRFAAAVPYEDAVSAGQTVEAVLSPLALYPSLGYDLAEGGVSQELSAYFWDLRDIPVDYEDDNFKVMCFYTPVALALLVLTVLFLAKPNLHPTYRQLDKYGPNALVVAAQIDAEYERSGVHREPGDKKTLYLDSWLVRRSAFMNAIRKNHLNESTGSGE